MYVVLVITNNNTNILFVETKVQRMTSQKTVRNNAGLEWQQDKLLKVCNCLACPSI